MRPGPLVFLSDQWIEALDDAAAATSTPAVPLVIEQRVTSDNGAEIEAQYHLDFTGDRLRAVRGPAPTPTVTFTTTRLVARAIAAGERSAQEAFRVGELRVGGDLTVLLEHQEVLASLDSVFAAVRARTVSDPEGPPPLS